MSDSETILNMHLVRWIILFLQRYITIYHIRNDNFWKNLQQVTVSCFKLQWLLYFVRYNIKQHNCFASSVFIVFVSFPK